jgi:hypothetical protein
MAEYGPEAAEIPMRGFQFLKYLQPTKNKGPVKNDWQFRGQFTY